MSVFHTALFLQIFKLAASSIRLLAFFLMTTGCSASNMQNPFAQPPRDEVIVLGMIHGGHRTSEIYSIDRIKELVREIKPDYILCEIPPDRFETAVNQYRTTGEITEPRVRVFPEYESAIIPMYLNEGGFETIPCAGWTREMSDDRNEKLSRWKTERPDEYAEMEAAETKATQLLEERDLNEDPLKIDLPEYDEIVRKGLEPYNRLFNDDLGPGGWDNINHAHFALITRAIDEHHSAVGNSNPKRFLITFGAWHKYWFLDHLRNRRDIRVLSLAQALQ